MLEQVRAILITDWHIIIIMQTNLGHLQWRNDEIYYPNIRDIFILRVWTVLRHITQASEGKGSNEQRMSREKNKTTVIQLF